MNKHDDFDAETIRLTAVRKASESGFGLGSEEYFRMLAEEVSAQTSLDISMGKPRPLLYKHLDESLDDSTDLVLIEITYLDYLCHALATEGDARIFALIPPIVQSHTWHNSKTDEDEQWVEVCGVTECSSEEWSIFLEELSSAAQSLVECLNKESERFIGFFGDASQLAPICKDHTVGLVRSTFAREEFFNLDSMRSLCCNVIVQGDSLTKCVESHAARCLNAVVWERMEASDCSMKLAFASPCMGNDHMRKIVEFLKGSRHQLFVWDSQHNSYTDQVVMVSIDKQEKETSVKVLGAEVCENPFPSFYLENQGSVRYVTLKEMVKKIARGTSLKGKDLSFCGDAMDEGIFGNVYRFEYTGRGDERGCYRPYRFYYVDNASIKPESDGCGCIVVAKRIETIPPKQERYTLLPEDDLILLVPRNGKNVVTYYAYGPTLVSNNLLVIWPDLEKVDPEYLAIAMNSWLVTSQLDRTKSALGKSDLEKLLIPMADSDTMSAAVARKQEIRNEVRDLSLQLEKLRGEDPLRQIRKTEID